MSLSHARRQHCGERGVVFGIRCFNARQRDLPDIFQSTTGRKKHKQHYLILTSATVTITAEHDWVFPNTQLQQPWQTL